MENYITLKGSGSVYLVIIKNLQLEFCAYVNISLMPNFTSLHSLQLCYRYDDKNRCNALNESFGSSSWS